MLSNRISLLHDEPDELDELDRNNVWGPEVICCKEELELCLVKRNSLLQQKAGINWLQKGDQNSKFFNKAIQKRSHRNKISCLHSPSGVVTDPKCIKNMFLEHFKKIFNQ